MKSIRASIFPLHESMSMTHHEGGHCADLPVGSEFTVHRQAPNPACSEGLLPARVFKMSGSLFQYSKERGSEED